MDSHKKKVEFIPATLESDHHILDAEEDSPLIINDWEETLNGIANADTKSISIPRSPYLKKERVLNAFHDAFELTGGIPRLALWADANPTEFYRLYAKMLPRQTDNNHNVDGDFVIRHVLPRGPLDE